MNAITFFLDELFFSKNDGASRWQVKLQPSFAYCGMIRIFLREVRLRIVNQPEATKPGIVAV